MRANDAKVLSSCFCTTAGRCAASRATWYSGGGTLPPTTSGCVRRRWFSAETRRRSTKQRAPDAVRVAGTSTTLTVTTPPCHDHSPPRDSRYLPLHRRLPPPRRPRCPSPCPTTAQPLVQLPPAAAADSSRGGRSPVPSYWARRCAGCGAVPLAWLWGSVDPWDGASVIGPGGSRTSRLGPERSPRSRSVRARGPAMVDSDSLFDTVTVSESHWHRASDGPTGSRRRSSWVRLYPAPRWSEGRFQAKGTTVVRGFQAGIVTAGPKRLGEKGIGIEKPAPT